MNEVLKQLFWISFAVIVYTYVGYSLAIALVARFRPRSRHRSPWNTVSARTPVSILLAVHNGAGVLASKIDHLLALDPELIREVIIVSDGSTDGTAEILEQTSLHSPGSDRLRAIVLPEHGGKAVALNRGMAEAQGEILLFLDIRPHIDSAAITALLSNFADAKVGCVGGELLLSTNGHGATALAVSGLYWKYEQWIRNCEAAWDSPVGVYGGFYAIRRMLATPIPPGTILDDMFQPLNVIRQGYRSVLDRTAFVTDRWPATTAGEFQRKVRTLAGNFQLVADSPWLLTPENRVLFQLVSHKLLRLVVPYFFLILLLTSAILGASSVAFASFAAVQILFWIFAALALKLEIPGLGRIAGPASALLVLNIAAVVGLYTFLFTSGPLWKIWSPTAIPSDTQMPLYPESKKA